MKKLIVMLGAAIVAISALSGCAMDKKDVSTTSDQTLVPTSSLSEKVSEDITDASEKVSEALTDASESLTGDTTK